MRGEEPGQARIRELKRALIDALWDGPTGIALFDADVRFLRVNDAIASWNGISPEAHVGRSLGEILELRPDDPRRKAVEGVEAAVRAVLETGQPRTNVPIEGTPPGDRARGWICSYIPMPELDGRRPGVCALVTDMSGARQREEEMERARDRAQAIALRLGLLQDVTSALARAGGAQEIARVVVERVRVAAGASVTTFRTKEGDALVVIDEAGVQAIRRRFGRVLVTAPLPVAEAVRSRGPVWFRSHEELHAHFPEMSEIAAEHGVRAGVALPLIAGADRDVLGVLSLGFPEPRAFDPDERAFLLSVAEHCAQALERAQLLDAERAQRRSAQQARDRLQRLQAVTAALSGASTVSEVAAVLVSQAKEALGASSSVAYVLDAAAGRLHMAAAIGGAEQVRDRLATLPLDAPLPGAAAARGGEPIWIETAEQLLAAFPELPRYAPHAARMKALAALPLKLGDRVLGAVSFAFDAQRAFRREERELILAAAQQCAQALDRARLLDAERGARAAEARVRAVLDAIFDNAPLGIGLLDPELRFARVNRVLAEINGVPAEAHVGKRPRELLPDMPHDEVEAAFREVLSTGQPKIDVELSGETPAAPGHLRHWVESWYPVRVAGATLGLGLLVREVTAEREAAEFQRNVLGIVGHDLRNPLSAITASAQLLLRQAGDPAAASRLGERILGNADRMQRIIAVLVDYARVRGGSGIPLRPRRCDLGAVCKVVAEECEAAHPGRAVRAAGAPDVHGEWDPDRVGQIVANLLSNALDYSPRDSTVEVSWRADAERAVIEVANEGAPIPPQLQPSLFEPFRRGERDRAGGKDGLGLGLFIARSIAIAHGGTLEVRSAPGERTVFTLALPR
ncbi:MULTISPECIES: PAS domain-containing protein [unclassified Anaeromyxobacter]|uniref:PAS domain-containing protein n=1 Tax=unclassified Anaeromyxobacter TaxID=2620896 RepID=UPI001F593E4C|nr:MULTISPECIES: PAS domain-containing protein [unclassified Anaeromyxobacter]